MSDETTKSDMVSVTLRMPRDALLSIESVLRHNSDRPNEWQLHVRLSCALAATSIRESLAKVESS